MSTIGQHKPTTAARVGEQLGSSLDPSNNSHDDRDMKLQIGNASVDGQRQAGSKLPALWSDVAEVAGKPYYLVSRADALFWGPFKTMREAWACARAHPPLFDPLIVGGMESDVELRGAIDVAR